MSEKKETNLDYGKLSITEINEDITELEVLLKNCTSPRIKNVLTEMLNKYLEHREQKVEELAHAVEDTSGPTKEVSVKKTPQKQTLQKKTPQALPQTAPENLPQKIKNVKSGKEKLYWNSIDTYSWDQTDEFVKVYCGKKYLRGVGLLNKENIQCDFEEEGFILSVRDLNGKNYKLTMKNLSKDYVPDQSKIWIGKNKVIVKLRKVKEKYGPDNWYDLTSKTKFKPSKTNDKDPTAGLMDMMKKMYDDGDDKMKETIGKAMYESRMKQNQGGGFDPPKY